MGEFLDTLKEMFVNEYIYNFDTQGKIQIIERVSGREVKYQSFEPIYGQDYARKKEFKFLMDGLSPRQMLSLWQLVITKQTHEHELSKQPILTDEIRDKLITLVNQELHKAKNKLLDEGIRWVKAVAKDNKLFDFAEDIVRKQREYYNSLYSFLKILEPIEAAKEALDLTEQITEQITSKVKNSESESKLKEIEEKLEISRREIEEIKSIKEEETFVRRLLQHLESGFISLGLGGLLELFKKLFGLN